MKVIVLASTKGGVGKSTLAECLAVAAVREGHSVHVCDLDPQQSTASWWRRRNGPDNPMLVTGLDTAGAVIRALVKRNAQRDYLLIDSPGNFLPVINDALAEAHCIIIVAQPSLKDLEGQGPVEGLIQKLNKVNITLYALNRVDKRSTGLLNTAIAVVKKKSVHNPVIIRDLKDFVKADQVGKTGNEINDDAGAEISALWGAARKIADVEGKGAYERTLEFKFD